MKHDPRLARPQPPVMNPDATIGDSTIKVVDAVPFQPALERAVRDDAEARRLWALGLIATCSNQSVLFGEVPTEERIAAAKEVLRLSRLPPRILK